MVYKCVQVLLSCGTSKKDIAVLTPYQAQAQLLSRVLHPVVGTVASTEAVKAGLFWSLSNVPTLLVMLQLSCVHPTQEREHNSRGSVKRSSRLSFVQPVRLLKLVGGIKLYGGCYLVDTFSSRLRRNNFYWLTSFCRCAVLGCCSPYVVVPVRSRRLTYWTRGAVRTRRSLQLMDFKAMRESTSYYLP